MFVFKSYQEAATSTHARDLVTGCLARLARNAWPLWLALALLLLSPAAQGQLYTGSVTGLVTDPSGASVPGAKVALVDQEKGYAFNAATDSTGRYLFRSIPPGTYKLRVEAASFQTQTQDAIKLDVSQNVSVDFSLKVGVVTDIVEVKANTVQLQTEDAVTGQVVNRKFVNDLPLLDRNFTNLTFLAPGVTESSAFSPQNPNPQGGINFNSNGGRNATSDVLIDGASATNYDQNSGILNVPYTPSVDSVEEFKVQQANFTAEYGFAGGTIVNVVTRSGSNQFHGSAYEFFRNSVMDANEWFNNSNGQPISPLKRNNFGGTVGGPIRKDKTFFFFDYEGTRENDATSSGGIGVPSLCERGDPSGTCPVGAPALGNFSELCAFQGGTFDNTGLCSAPAGQLWDPYSTQGQTAVDPNNGAIRNTFIPFNNLATYASAGNPNLAGTPFQPAPGVPGNLIDPVAAKLLLLFPKPTINATDLPTLQGANFFSSGVNTSSNNQFDIKVDHRFSERDLLSVRYSQEKSTSTSFNSFGNFADPLTSGPGLTTRHLVAINHTHTFSPTVVLTVTYGLVRGFDKFPGIAGQFPDINSSFASLGFPSYLNNGFGTIPAIQLIGYGSSNGNNNIGSNPFTITREGQDAHHLSGAVGWARGKHDLKFGGEGRLRRINHGNPGWPSGFFNFDFSSTSQFSAVSGSGGDSLASFLTGVGPVSHSPQGCTPCQQGFDNFVSTQSFQIGSFAQDNYKVTSKLTLNLGLRYELNTPRTERFNRMNFLDPNAISPLSGSSLGALHGAEVFVGPNDRYNYALDTKNIQPRFGLAYQLPHAFVVRGGYGLYFSTPRSSASGTGPGGFQGFNIQPDWLTSLNLQNVVPYNTLSNTSCSFSIPVTCGVAPAPGNSLGAFNDIGSAAGGPVKQLNRKTPYEQTWSFGFQKELPFKVLVDANYVGKKGTHLYLGGFNNLNLLPASVLNGVKTPADFAQLNANLTTPVANPFFFDPTQFPPGTACDRTKFVCNPVAGLFGPTVPASQLLLPFPQYTGFTSDSFPIANSIYHAVQVRAERDFSNGLQFLLTYVWSKSIDDASATDGSVVFLGGGNGSNTLNVQNPYDLPAERSVSVFDIPQILQLSYVYELPVGRGKALGRNMNPILNAIVGGWQTNGIIRIDDGRPLLSLLLNTNALPGFNQRPILTGTLHRASGSPENSTPGGTSYFSNASFDPVSNDNVGVLLDTSVVAPHSFGSAPRTITSVRQPGARDVSMSLFKDFGLSKVHEGMRLQFRAESFNTFNHPHFNGPNTTVGDSNFGIITSTLNLARQLQLALKLSF